MYVYLVCIQFAGAPKGCSCIIYKNKKIWIYQVYSYVNWCGGMYTAPGFRGSGNGM